LQKILICINAGWVESSYALPNYAESGFPQVVNALLGIGNMVLKYDLKTKSIVERTFEFQDSTFKYRENHSISSINTNYFLNPEYSYISGVLYSYANANYPIDEEALGIDFYLIHNPLAINPLPKGCINCGIEYDVQIDSSNIKIKSIDHTKN
jgi:hypothetical protein